MLTALFVGLGSIGTRHLQNLTALCRERGLALACTALRSDAGRPLPAAAAGLVSYELGSVSELEHYDLAFITNPTALHAETLAAVRGHAGALFVEKPIVAAEERELPPEALVLPGQKAYVAAPMRWCGVMLALRGWLAENPALRPYSVRAICSSYLPDWRPGVDYRTVYSAQKALGGGVSIDLIHEWDYLVALFGTPLEVSNFRGTYSDLELDSDDLSVYIARYPHMLAELHLDYFGRSYRRTLEVFTREGTLVADFGAGTLTLPNGAVQRYEEPVNRRYEREMEYFLDYALEGKGESVNPPREALRVLALAEGLIP